MTRRSRRDSARQWVASGAAVDVQAHARRYGVDRCTAHDDLLAIGFPVSDADGRWAVRPAPAPKRSPIEPVDEDDEDGWTWVGDQRMFVAGYTAGGAPYGYIEEADTDYL